MLRTLANAGKLFVAGRLFRHPRAVWIQWTKGFAACLVLMLGFGWFVSPLVGVVVASWVGGALQPWLFRELRFA